MAREVRSPVKIAAVFLFVLLVLEMFAMAFNGEPVLVVKAQSDPPFSDVVDIHNVGPYTGCYLQYVVYDPSNGYLYVTVTGANTVSVVDPSSNSVMTSIPVGSQPVPITYDSSNGNIYVGNTGGYGSVSVISGATNTVIATIRLNPGGFATPSAMAYDSANQNVYVAVGEGLGQEGTQGGVVVISGSTNSVTATIVLPIVGGGTTPNGVAFDPANNEVYVCAGYVYYINAQNQFSSPITVFPSAAAATLTYDSQNQNLYVTSLNNHYVGVVYSSSNTAGPIIQIVPPYTFADVFDPLTNEVLVTINPSDMVSVVEPSSNTVSYSITLPPNSFPEGIAWDSSNGNLYVVESNLNILSVLSNGVSPSYTVSLTAGNGGSLSYNNNKGTNGTVNSGQTQQISVSGSVSLTAKPDGAHVFSSWTTTGSVAVSGSTMIVSGNGGVTANFVSNLAVWITPGLATVQLGNNVTFTAFPSGGVRPYNFLWEWESQGGPVIQGSQSTGSSNQFIFTPASLANYSVWVVVTDSVQSQNLSPYCSVTVQQQPVSPIGSLQIVAYDGSIGYPLTGASVQMTSAPNGGTLQTGKTDSGGEITWSGLNVGDYAVSVTASGFKQCSGAARVLAGQQGEITVILSHSVQTNLPSPLPAPQSIGQGIVAANGYVYYTDTANNKVTVFSQGSGEVVISIPVGKAPVSLAAFAQVQGILAVLNNIVVCANQGDGTVSMINSTTNTVIQSVSVGSEPTGIAVDSNTGQVFVTDFGSAQMTVLNLVQYPQIQTFNISLSDSPTGIAVDPYTNTAYVSLYDSHCVDIVSVNSTGSGYNFQGTVNVGAYPLGIALTIDSGRLYVANSGDGTVSIVLPTSNGAIMPSSQCTTVVTGGNPIGVAVTQASQPSQTLVFVVSSNQNGLACINDWLWNESAPIALSYSFPISSVCAFGNSQAVLVNPQNQQLVFVETAQVNFDVQGGGWGSFSLSGLTIGAPYVYLPVGVYLPLGTYSLYFTSDPGYLFQSIQTTGAVTYDSSSNNVSIAGSGTITANAQKIQNWATDPAFHVDTYYINLASASGVAAALYPPAFLALSLLVNLEKLSQNPISISVIQPSSSGSQYATQLNHYFSISPAAGTDGAGDYVPGLVLLLHIPIIQIMNCVYGLNLPLQQYNLQLASTVSSILGLASSLETTQDGSLNMVFTLSYNNNSYDQVTTALNVASSVIAEVLKPSGDNLKAAFDSVLQGVLDSTDLSINMVTSDLNNVGNLSSYILFDLYKTKTTIDAFTTVLGICQKWLDLADNGVQAGATFGAQLLADVRFCLTAADIGIDEVALSVNNNDFLNGLATAVDTVTTIVDPNGSTIIPSYYDAYGNLVLGYNSTSGDVIFSSSAGILLSAGDSYFAYFYENTSYPTSYTLQLNQIGGNDPVPYVVATGSYNTSVAGCNYAGMVNATDLSISTSVASDGSLISQPTLIPQVVVKETSSGYDVRAAAYTDDGAMADARAGYLVVDGTTYAMLALNSSTFEYVVPYMGEPAVATYLSSGFAGGYANVQLPLYVSVSPASPVTLDVGQSQTFNSTVSGGTLPYSYQWCLNGAAVPSATFSSWTFTPSSAGSYTVYANATDSVGAQATSNNANVTVSIAEIHDVAVTNVASSKTMVGQGFSANINVIAANEGDFTETFNVTAYANATIIGSENVTLPAGNSTMVTFTWKTTGFAYGNYSLSAYAWPVPGETNMANNNFTGGTVKVTIPGDVNGDGIIDIYDAIILAHAFNSSPGNLHWNANADINGDNSVDIYDAIILAGHFNQHYP